MEKDVVRRYNPRMNFDCLVEEAMQTAWRREASRQSGHEMTEKPRKEVTIR